MNPPSASPLTPERIAYRSGSNFLVSFAAAEPDRRAALTAVYAFCRLVDDAVDDRADDATAAQELAFWSEELARAERDAARTPVGRGLAAAMQRYGVQRQHLQNVIDGVTSDLHGETFAAEEDLERYCYRVACSVGLACLPLFEAEGPAAEGYAIELGHALQLTNVLRDLAEDARGGRCYVPASVLRAHGAQAGWLGGDGEDCHYAPGGAVDGVARWLADRAEARFAGADRHAQGELRVKLLPAEVMGAVYRVVLQRATALGGEVCRRRRIRVAGWRKLLIARRVRREIRTAR